MSRFDSGSFIRSRSIYPSVPSIQLLLPGSLKPYPRPVPANDLNYRYHGRHCEADHWKLYIKRMLLKSEGQKRKKRVSKLK